MTIALSPLSMRRRPCHCHDGAIALITLALLPLIRDGIVALVVMALSWCCCPWHNGIVVIINVQASSPSLQWCCYLCHDGIIAIDMQASLPSLQW
jgi:hypothetical protein